MSTDRVENLGKSKSKYFFQKLENEFSATGFRRRSLQSVNWFRTRIKELNLPSRPGILRDTRVTRRNLPLVGRMYMYFYDPKYKKTLPYYDRFPLIIMVGPDENGTGFYGLNLHYLNYMTRAAFLDSLIEMMGYGFSSTEIKDSARLRLTYDKLKATSSLKEFRPCFKHYLYDHVRSGIGEVLPTDWEAAIFLPLARFEKKSMKAVWTESARIAKGR